MNPTAPANPAGHDDAGVAIAPTVGLRMIARRFWPYARPYRKWIALSLLLVVIVPAIETAKIWMFKLVIDDVLVPKDFGPFVWIAAVFLALTLVGGAIAVLDDTLSAWIGERFVLAARLDLFRHLHRISLVSLGRRKMGDVIARLTGDVGAIEGFVVGGLTNAVAYGAEAAFFTTALFLISWQLALISLVVAPLFWFAARRFSDLIRDASRERRRRSGTISAVAEESLANAALVQAYHRQEHEAERFRGESEANFTASMRSARLQALFSPAVEVIEVLGALIVIGFGTWQLSSGHLTIGGLLVFLTYLTQMYEPIRGLSKLATSLHSAAAGAERVVEILDEPAAVIAHPEGAKPQRCAASCASPTSASRTATGAPRRCAACRSPSRPAASRRWSDRTAPASRRSPGSRCACTTPTSVACCSTAATCAAWTSSGCTTRWRSCCRTASSWTQRSGRTSRSAGRMPPTRRSRRRRGARARTSSSSSSRRIRDPGRPSRGATLRRSAPANRDRPGIRPRRADRHPGRAHQPSRCVGVGRAARRGQGAGARSHDDRHHARPGGHRRGRRGDRLRRGADRDQPFAAMVGPLRPVAA